MSEGNFTLDLFYQWWSNYQDRLKHAIAPLTPEQLALRAAPGLRSVGEIVAHVISSRVAWFGDFLGEMSSMLGVEALLAWDTDGDGEMRDVPPRTADELVEGLDTSWRFMADLLNRWDSADMQHTFPFESNGHHYDNSRSWVTWHILEHDLHHGGEISIMLGMHGLQPLDV
ncbi:MAG TPA: DinB family protein [Chloroflexia bacterium]|nr:DinB family protein [Chloroflexia bacterium]